MKIQLLGRAEQDLQAGYAFYEQQSQGLGDYFLDTLFSDIDGLLLHAGVHERHASYYRLLSKRFPFAVYYTIEQEVILVWAVLDCRQQPHTLLAKLMGWL